jgi:Rha family phage regulatory protein
MEFVSIKESIANDKITSLEVADMVGKEHNKLLRDVREYIDQLDESKIGHTDFFTESEYTDKANRKKPCYLVTKKGCEFIAHKLTGVKGTAFTAKYINRFHEMEDQLKPKAPQTYLEALKALVAAEEAKEELQAQLDVSKDWYSIKRVAAMNGVDWKTFNWRKLKEKSIELGYGIKKIFDANYGEVNTYHRDAWEAAYPDYEI